MKVGRGAQSAMSSWASTGRSLAFLLADDGSAKRTVDDERGGGSPRRADDGSAKRTVDDERGGASPRRADDASAKRTVDDERGGASPRRAEDASAAPYSRKLPAIQWYSPDPVRFSTASPKLRRGGLAPPPPGDPTGGAAERGSQALWARAGLPVRRIRSIPSH